MKKQHFPSQDTEFDPWVEQLNTYTGLVQNQGFHPASIQSQRQLILRFREWLRRRHTNIQTLDEIRVQQFLRCQPKAQSLRRGDAATLYRFLHLLRRQGVVPPQQKPPLSPKQQLIRDYERYLLEERGLAQATVTNNVGFIDQFLSARLGMSSLRLHQLRAPDITTFVRRQAHKLSPGRAPLLVTALRSFLGYLRYQGKIMTDLAICVPTVARWSFATLPKFLLMQSVRKVLAYSKRRRTSLGRRDYAILLLLARLGLRACEMVALNLEDLDWEKAKISIRAKGGRWDQLPLPADVGKALALYLRYGRPSCSSRRVFIRNKAPRRGLARSQTICALVRSAIKRAGVDSARKGAHLFRHSLATHMIRRGASLDEIGELLRHRSPNTTAIYAKVDLPALRRLALPWLGGAR